MSRERQQAYEARKANARAEIPEPRIPSPEELRGFGFPDELCGESPETLLNRYESSLILFLQECFPATTSLSEFGPAQKAAIATMENVLICGGTQQVLLPRSFGKSSVVARAALWALLFGKRRCGVIFQSSAPKAADTLQKIKNELAGNVVLRFLFPFTCGGCRHITQNKGLSSQQHYQGERTHIEWLKESLRLPSIGGETGGGGRLICKPFSKAAGLALSDPVTLEDIRPDLLLPDDVQSHDDARSPTSTQKLVDMWHGSVKYLPGRSKSAATIFTQTIFEVEDFADRLSVDPSIQTVKYQLLESFPEDMDWWKGPYKEALLSYDEHDPLGQKKATDRANKLYLENRGRADKGASVSWENAFDPGTAHSAIQQAMNNYLMNEKAFWAQDQNSPDKMTGEGDIRCSPRDISLKQGQTGAGVVPSWADKLVCHVDVQDRLLYFSVCAGSGMRMQLIKKGTFPGQGGKIDFQYRHATHTLDTIEKYASLTLQDRIRAALNDLVKALDETPWENEGGERFTIESIGVDCSDGDHWDTVHAYCRETLRSGLIPMKGAYVKASHRPLNQRGATSNEKRRGDHWIYKVASRTKQAYLEVDANFWKTRLHKGLCAPPGTSESVELYKVSDERIHRIIGDHCNAETPRFVTSTTSQAETVGQYEWELIGGRDNHFLDNLAGCLCLLNFGGARFQDAAPEKRRRRVRASELQKKKRKRQVA